VNRVALHDSLTRAVCDAPPLWHIVRSDLGVHLLIVPGSNLFDIDDEFALALERRDPSALDAVASQLYSVAAQSALEVVPDKTTPQSISLNVSSACNLGCSYCYAGGGRFGGAQRSTMSWETARAAVDRLAILSDPSVPITIGFMGGEPFLNRDLIHRVVEYTRRLGAARRQPVRFSVTTNGTLLDDSDIAMLRENAFAVTVSIDGGQALNDAQRPLKSGGSSHSLIAKCLRPLFEQPGNVRLGARVTVTGREGNLQRRFDAIVALGFAEVGFSPVRRGSPSDGGLALDNWPAYLAEMIGVARGELAVLLSGGSIRLTNFAIALRQLHRGACMPYPCGAGGGYFSVAADSTWYACHRAIGQKDYAMGDNTGLNEARRGDFLRERHVHAQPACQSCWARYLCSGGCHHEASDRSDSSCGFIRGWLEFCIKSYSELLRWQPQWFATGNPVQEAR
jgi:uncharacterized protein